VPRLGLARSDLTPDEVAAVASGTARRLLGLPHGRIDVDVVFAGASFPVALDTPAEEVEALVNMGDGLPS
jgi:hypothetical protein